MNNPFILNEEGNYITILDKNYYIIEYMPFNENYICRIHMDNNKNIIEKFFLASKNNNIIDGIPVFDALKLSFVCTNNIQKLYNVELAKKTLCRDDYELALSQLSKIKKNIKKGNCMNTEKTKENLYFFLDIEENIYLCSWKMINPIGNIFIDKMNAILARLKENFNEKILTGKIEEAFTLNNKSLKDNIEYTKKYGQCMLCEYYKNVL